MMRTRIAATVGFLTLIGAIAAGCGGKGNGTMRTSSSKSQGAVAKSRPTTIDSISAPSSIRVTSRGFSHGGVIPEKYADYGQKISPDLQFDGIPANAKSIVVLVEDPDAPSPTPFVHWVLYNLPSSQSKLREALPTTPRLKEPDGVLQGHNSRGSIGYFGPHPPAGPAHHYHFQVFAIDRLLDVPPAAELPTIVAAMKDHVVAKGELVGTYQKKGDQ